MRMSDDYPNEGWVYLLTHPDLPGIVKICCTRSLDLEERRATVNREVARPFEGVGAGKLRECVQGVTDTTELLDDHEGCRERGLIRVEGSLAQQRVVRAQGRKVLNRTPYRVGPSLSRTKHLRLTRKSRKSRKYRIPALYNWLLDNHDAVYPRMEEAGGVKEENPAGFVLLADWRRSLPDDSSLRVPGPRGLLVQGSRVSCEMTRLRKSREAAA